jgi:hypothetical protein
MVVVAAAICTKSGKALLSRQFVDITRSRIEGLLSAFNKLVGLSSKQHTFIETESVRYLYQPLEDLYIVLITSKSSNIVEDLETLHIIAKLVPEYTKTFDEASICQHTFELVFAFDEVVALGYREKVTLQQVKTFTEMDSQEEKIYEMIEKNKERMAKKEANRKRLEIEKERREREKMGLSGFSSGGIGRSSISSESTSYESYTQPYISGAEKSFGSSSSRSVSDSYAGRNSSTAREPKKERKGLLIKKTSPANEQFEAMRAKGEIEEDVVENTLTTAVSTPLKEDVHLQIVEKLLVELDRDGGLEKIEVRGELIVEIKNEKYDKIYIKMKNETPLGPNIQFRTHPNIDAERWTNNNEITLVSAVGSGPQQNTNTSAPVSRSYPINTPTSVLKWRFLPRDIKWLPLIVNCWPTPSKDICLVTLEYELCNQPGFEVNNVLVKIPIVAKAPPNVTQAVGSYKFDPKSSILTWEIPLVNSTNRKGTIEFELSQWESGKSDASSLFPIVVTFSSDRTLCNLEAQEVRLTEGGESVKFTQTRSVSVESYLIK